MSVVVAEVRTIEPGEGRRVLVVVAHADDPALFIGGTIAAWSSTGWEVIVLRMTDDRWDSVGLDEASTIAANQAEFRNAADLLGVHTVIDAGMPTDVLGDASTVEVREQIIRAIRTHRPYALVGFDPYAMFGEDNLDHLVVGRATDEAFWTSQFDLHHPEHRALGLEPHGCFERWYFGRKVVDVTDVIDTSEFLERKVDAALAHPTMMQNLVNQLRLQAHTGGWRVPLLDDAHSAGDPRRPIELFVRQHAALVGATYGLTSAEEFRVVRFNGLTELLQTYGVRA